MGGSKKMDQNKLISRHPLIANKGCLELFIQLKVGAYFIKALTI